MKPTYICLFLFTSFTFSFAIAGTPTSMNNSIPHSLSTGLVESKTSKISEIDEFNVNIGWNHPCGNSLELSRRINNNKFAFGFGESLNGIRFALIYSRFLTENGIVKPVVGIGFGIVTGAGVILQETDRNNWTKLVQTGITINPRFTLRFDDLGSPFDLSFGYVFAPRFNGNFFNRSKEISYPLEGIEISITKVFQFI